MSQVTITPDHVQPSTGARTMGGGTQIGQLIEFYSTETAKVLNR